LSLRMDHLW